MKNRVVHARKLKGHQNKAPGGLFLRNHLSERDKLHYLSDIQALPRLLVLWRDCSPFLLLTRILN